MAPIMSYRNNEPSQMALISEPKLNHFSNQESSLNPAINTCVEWRFVGDLG